ncbi:GAF domain-containing protein [Catenulispora sp. NL8]|uniref:GAF domain-containing protein n=1 Tax=Catenulispora pinistramenti TaxID=2705254 RepID=A0ABS5KRC2_9ACTN|nr:GAF domain-containing protein [Catenulispora pinistramenti]MBS2548587.1 GAF domain-containing protein [Catenulispora pinistramenti]
MADREPDEPRNSLLPQLRMDELLDELISRVTQIRATRDRVQQLLQGVLAVSGGLELDQVLSTIIGTAAELVDAQYGALGVIDSGGEHLERFVTVGLTQREIDAIGPFPTGMGLLGQLIRHPVPLRLAEIAEHESSFGFPDDHPPMRTFLGVPIRVRDKIYGNLYLTEKRGGSRFDADDETLLSTLAAAAGVAIDNARLYDDAQSRQRWMTATAELTRGLLSGADARNVLAVLVERVRDMAGAELVMVSLPDPAADHLTVQVAAGPGGERVRGDSTPIAGSEVGAVFAAGVGRAIVDGQWDDRQPWTELGLGPAYIAPLGTAGKVRGVLVAAKRFGALPFDAGAMHMLTEVGGQAAVALELADRRADVDLLALYADRDRIGRDLHDLAIQRLFATGMTLQSVLKITDKQAVRDRVNKAVSELDDTIKVIRSTIFALSERGGPDEDPGLRAQVLQVCQDSATVLGFTPAVRFTGPIDFEVSDEAAEHALAVVREALSNVGRHAQATKADVDVATADGFLVLRVADNGVGMPEGGGRRSGLGNLADRAVALGGEFTVGPAEGGGTVLTWRVPLDD